MIDVSVKYDVIDKLRTLPVCRENYSKTQFVVRCPYCGDSVVMSHSHFSIHINVMDDSPMMVRCLRCDTSGLFDADVMDDLGLYGSGEMAKALKSFNRKSKRKYNITENIIEEYYVPRYVSNVYNQRKLNYINHRLGLNMDMDLVHELKCVINLFDFLKLNKIERLENLTFRQIEFLDKNYVGFLSANNNYITFRNITDNNYKRYYKLILNPRNIGGTTYYKIPNPINLMYTNPINIHIAEGYFDILSVALNLVGRNEDEYFYASCGFGFNKIIKRILTS